MPVSLLKVETVTPRSAPRFLAELEATDRDLYDHLCLELVHWGFDEAMAWIYKLKTVCDRKRPKMIIPCVSVFGYETDVIPEMVQALMKSGALWIPRNEDRTKGKDGATIIREMVTVNAIKPRRKIIVDPDDYRELSVYDTAFGGGFRMIGSNFQDLDLLVPRQGLPDDEFKELIHRAMDEIETLDA